MTRMPLSRTLLALPLAAFILAADAEEPSAPARFSPEAWREAPQSGGSGWSREALLHEFAAANEIAGMTRGRVLALLGEPGYSGEIYYPGSGRTGRIDVYRLSAANRQSYRIDYDAEDKATGSFAEASPCGCDLCKGELPLVAPAVLEAAVLKKDAAREGKRIPVAELAALLGRPGKESMLESPAGGQMWLNYSEIWAVSGKERRFFIASGHRPLRDWQRGPLDRELLDSFGLVTLTAECAAP